MTTTLYQRSRAGTLPRTGRFHHDGTTTTKCERRPSSGTAYRFSPRVTNAGIDPIADRKVQEHLAYLRRLANQKIVSVELANKARAVWVLALLSTKEYLHLPVPAASALQGGPIEYHWSAGAHQLLLEIPPDGLCHWTYKNKTTGEL